MFTFKVVPWRSRLECQSSKRKVLGSSPTVGKNFSFCNSRFLDACLTKRMKSSVTYTVPIPCYIKGSLYIYCFILALIYLSLFDRTASSLRYQLFLHIQNNQLLIGSERIKCDKRFINLQNNIRKMRKNNFNKSQKKHIVNMQSLLRYCLLQDAFIWLSSKTGRISSIVSVTIATKWSWSSKLSYLSSLSFDNKALFVEWFIFSKYDKITWWSIF